MTQLLKNKLIDIMSNVFEINSSTITEDSSPDTVKEWDSLHHINLVLSLEDEFQVAFSDEELGEMLSFKLILSILKEKLKED